jgi:hypothetical protein
MGSTKHIRNNGEHLNIHGHDNYQMPGAYKQMGDMNQNQPSKISGGAAKYIKEAYGANKIGDDPETAAQKAARLAAEAKNKNKTSGDVTFKIDDSGATLNKSKTVTSSTPSSSSSQSSTPIVDKGEDVFYNNLTSSAKDMSAMSAAGIDVNDRKAVLNYGNNKAKSMKSSSSSSTSSSSSSENNPVTIKSINSASNYAMKEMLGDKNRDVYAGEMQAKKDSTSAYQKTFKNLIQNNPNAGLGSKVLSDFGDIAGRYGSRAANATREKNNIPLVKSKTDMPQRSFWNGKETTPSYINPDAPGGKSKIVESPTTYSRSTPIYADFGKLYGPENNGPNKGIHSSRGYGINKILKQYK